MKILFKIVSVLLIMISFSCSNYSDSTTVEADVFQFVYNDVSLNITNPTQFYDGGVSRTYDQNTGLFTLHLHTTDDVKIDIFFDKKGQLVDVTLFYWANNVGIQYATYKNFSSNYFNFQITNFDDINNRIKGNFSGKLYRNNLNLNSEFIEVNCNFNLSCDFDLNYNCSCDGLLEGLGMTADINNQNYISTSDYNGFFLNGGPYKIEVNALGASNLNETYSFTPSTPNHYVRVYKFNTATLQYEVLDSTGSVVFTSYLNNCCSSVVIKANFNLTAVNPNNSSEVPLQIINGKCKYIYQF
ncbi:hypothetical protein [Flavobacterium sp.]